MAIEPFPTPWTQFPLRGPTPAILASHSLSSLAPNFHPRKRSLTTLFYQRQQNPHTFPTNDFPIATNGSSNTTEPITTPMDEHKTLISIVTKPNHSSTKNRLETTSSKTAPLHKPQRGRPILDTQDEGTLKRRRTQIRTAQRTFRLRSKKNTLALETRILALERTINDLNNAFLDINDCVESSGILQRGEKWGREMRGCMERVWGIVEDGEGFGKGVMRAGFGKGEGERGGDVAVAVDEGWERFSVWGYEIVM